MEYLAENILDEIGIPLNVLGYKFMCISINIMDTNPFLKTNELYKEIAKKYTEETKAIIKQTNVERSIRYVNEVHKDKIQKFFNINYKINNQILIKLLYREYCRRREKR